MPTAPRQTSAEALTDGLQLRKRPRPAVSCLRCREKKLKCDRVTPCQNCTKAGCSGDCTYSQGSASSEPLPMAKRAHLSIYDAARRPDQHLELGRATGVGILEDLQQRVIRLEERFAPGTQMNNSAAVIDSLPSHASGQRPSKISPESSSSRPFLGTLVVKGDRTRYHGQNNRITLLNQFAEAKEFIAQCTKDSSIVGLAKEVQFLQGKLQHQIASPVSTLAGDVSPELVQLHASLPAKAVCDRLLDTYTTNFEKIFRIIHVPSFLRQYAQFWAEPDHESYRSSSAFLPQLTAICAISVSLERQSTRVNDLALWDYLNGTALIAIKEWLRKISRKQRTDLAPLQADTLLLLARRLRLVSAEELWRATGTLVRSAMVMGLHLNLSECTELSIFQAEIRRRLWITIVEMDLQASATAGMPVMISQHDIGPPPANLNDSDMDESTTELQPPRPLSQWTDSLTQVSLATSLPERVRAMALVRRVDQRPDFDKLVQQGRKIEECLRQIPAPLKAEQTSMIGDSPAVLLNRVLLDVYTRRPLLCLYRSVVLGNRGDGPAFLEIHRVCLESSVAILSHQDYFDPNVADLEIFDSNAYWDLFQILCNGDVLWAALSVCGCIKHANQRIPNCNLSGITAQGMHSKASLTRTVENTLDSLTLRIGEAGSNLKDILLLSVVLQSIRARGSAQLQEHWMSQGAKKALSACRQHLLPAVAENSLAINLTDFAQILQTTQPIFTSTAEAPFTPAAHLQLPEDSLSQSSELAAEFTNFQGDPFSFGDGSFAWNL
ncbi:fungal-specific transcription factor domain-containing protein [Aspergillus leporis]|uniref:Fungal-specific transcription factor domain-containing protein n=1 Tax=Aspergillus leporis TaxID=41062 RepID=A0A5N5WUW4_9EURO|nr:fungal-specific transcription factor domain-containing protein [Aspergillus leporis]